MSVFLDFLNRASDALLRVDPDSKAALARLEGKVLCIEITAPRLTLYMRPSPEGLKIEQHCDAKADVTLTGSAMAFIKLGTAGTGSRVLSEQRVTIHGDSEIGQAFQKILAQLDIDWEELLALYIGDTPARKAGNVARNFGNWAAHSLALSRRNTGEFLQEEKRVLVTPLAMQRFQNSIDKLRADTDRMEQRISRLKKNLHAKAQPS